MTMVFLSLSHVGYATEKQYGIGYQFGGGVLGGLSGKFKIDEKITGEIVLGGFGSLKGYSGRGIYDLGKINENFNKYAYGSFGIITYEYDEAKVEVEGTTFTFTITTEKKTETSTIIAGGIGINGSFFDIPDISWNTEIGYAILKFDNKDYTGVVFGGGMHYKF